MNRCPHCGGVIAAPKNKHTFQSTSRTPLRQTAAPPMYPPPVSITSPIGQPTMEANVHVPANQAIITGCLFAPVVGLTVYTIMTFGKASTGEAILAGSIAGGIALFGTATWQWLSKTAFYDSLLQTVEMALDVDLDGDSKAGSPSINVEVKSEDGNRWQFADLPGQPEALREFAKRVLMGQGFTDETGKLAGLTQKETGDLRVAFVDRGWAEWKHATRKQQGIDLLHVGKSVLRAISTHSPTLPAST